MISPTTVKTFDIGVADGTFQPVVVPIYCKSFMIQIGTGIITDFTSFQEVPLVFHYSTSGNETDHFGAGKVVGNRITGLTTALDANNTVKQISSAKSEMQIEWMPGFDYDESVGDQNIVSWRDYLYALFHKASGYLQIHDGTSWGASALINYQKNISYDINCVYGDHPTEGANKMQIIITDGTTTWESPVVDFDGSFNPADFLTPFFGNTFLNYIKSVKMLKEQESWA